MPCTARWPIEPPGKRSGCTTNESVDNARRAAAAAVSTAPSPELVAERLEEHRVDQRGRRLAAGAVGQRDDLVVQPGPTAAERLDAVEDLGLARRPGPVMELLLSVADGGPQRDSPRGPAPPGSGGRCGCAPTKQYVHIGRRRHLAAVVAGEPDREHAAGAGLAEPGHEVAGAAAGRHADGDVARPGAGDELAGEHEVEADVVAQRGEHRLVGGERPGRAAARRRGGRANSATRVGASVELPPLPNVNSRPPAANRRGHLGGRRRDQRRGWRPAWTRAAPRSRRPWRRPRRRGRAAARPGRAPRRR